MLHPDQFYHIYNHANGDENLFREEKNYYFFLNKAKLYLLPYVKIYAYCIMPNHFHLLISIRSEKTLKAQFMKVAAFHKLKEMEQNEYVYRKISKSFANLCSSYTQAFNKVYQRKGSLFIPNFKMNPIEDDPSFCAVTHYIHANPVHHGFVKDIRKWKFSSFIALCSQRNSNLEREYVHTIFGGKQAFLEYHLRPIDRKYKWHD